MSIKALLLGGLRRYFHITIYKFHYLAKVIDKKEVEKQIQTASIPATELLFEDFLKGDKDVFDEQKLALYKGRFAGGNYKAYGIIVDGHLVYSSWVSFEKVGMPIETKSVLLNQREGYFEDDYCSKEYRGQGIHTRMIWFRLNELIKHGKNVAIITIMDGNLPAIKPAIKCGFKDMGCFYCGKIFGKKFNTLKKEKYSI